METGRYRHPRVTAALGYPRLADRPGRRERRNPTEVVLRCLRAPDVDARVVEALDLQNRLGFLVSLAAEAADREGRADARAPLTSARALLERSRLAAEGAFRTTLSEAERRWLRQHRPPAAA
jgi:hypothetical protein